MDNKDSKSEKKTVQKSVADKIWENIKDKKINMFALPGQTVSNYCSPTPIEPSKCYLTYQVTSILPALEAALGKEYVVEMAGRFISVANAPITLD